MPSVNIHIPAALDRSSRPTESKMMSAMREAKPPKTCITFISMIFGGAITRCFLNVYPMVQHSTRIDCAAEV